MSRPVPAPPVPAEDDRSFDTLLDWAVARATSTTPMFSDGWGDPALLDDLLERLDTFEHPRSIEIHWFDGRRTRRGLYRFRGWFPTPDMSLPLPGRSRPAYVELLLPGDAFEGELPPICIHLAGTGDATHLGRRMLAAPLAKSPGIGALILQNPLYGERKPRGQQGTALRRITDQFLMNAATLEEARSLVRWSREEGYRSVGLTGYSMGGYMAAMTAQTLPWRVAAIPCATGNTAVYPLVESPLSKTIDWEALEAELPSGVSARARAADIMEEFALDRHGTLDDTRAAIVVGGLRDAFIRPDTVARLHLHWEGSELRWMDAGHTTGWLGHADVVRDAIADAFERLERG